MSPTFDKSWTLFLDRDGVINVRPVGDYVRNPEQFHFLPDVPEAIAQLTKTFARIIVVTNQQGVAKGLYTENDLSAIHKKMTDQIEQLGGKISRVYYSPDLATSDSPTRKPATGMADWAKKDFPDIQFHKSVIIGDSLSDMQFGEKLGMHLVFLSDENNSIPEQPKPHQVVTSLAEFVSSLQ
jgi:histidinol-phosphate phosphatase family protein